MNQNLIFDIGAHQGEDSDFYLKKGFHVVAVEANPDMVTKLRDRFSQQVAQGAFTLVPKAIGGGTGTVNFYKYDDMTVWGTIDRGYVDRNKGFVKDPVVIEVETLGLPDLIKQYGCPYYAKIDVEGVDLLCLKSLSAIKDRPKYISVEASDTNPQEVREQFAVLMQLGYQKFKVIGQHRVHRQTPPHPAKEGKYTEYHFVGGESGLFGEEAPGDWVSLEKAQRVIDRFFRQARITGRNFGIFRNVRNRYLRAILGRIAPDGTGWYDIHATY